MLAVCPAGDLLEKDLKTTHQPAERKLEIMTPLEIMALEIYGCIDVCVHTGTSA